MAVICKPLKLGMEGSQVQFHLVFHSINVRFAYFSYWGAPNTGLEDYR